MATSPFIAYLRVLHGQAKAGKLEARDRAQYEHGRREVLRVAFAEQTAAFPGKPQRETMRIPLALKLELAFSGGTPQSVTTVDVSSNGFAALLAFGVGVGAQAQFVMRLPGGVEPISGKCRVAGLTKQGGLQRLSFTLDGLDPAGRERLNEMLFDYLIQRVP